MLDYSITLLGKNYSNNLTIYLAPTFDFSPDGSNYIYVSDTTNLLSYSLTTGLFTVSGGTLPADNILNFSGLLTDTTLKTEWSFLLRSSFLIDHSTISGLSFRLLDVRIVKILAYIVQPSDLDESIELKYWGGGLMTVPKCRLQIKIKTKFFKNYGYFNDNQGQAKFWILKQILRMKYKQIYNLGNGFDRWVSITDVDADNKPQTAVSFTNLQLLYPSLKLPLNVEVLEYGDLESMPDKNKDATNFTLVTPDWFNFE